jgi:hypothetical protein
MIVLASRDRYCVNAQVIKEAGSNKGGVTAACDHAREENACRQATRVVDLVRDLESSAPLLDVEELVAKGRRSCACPYYASQNMLKDARAQLILCPYNYLIDASIRAALHLNVQGDMCAPCARWDCC